MVVVVGIAAPRAPRAENAKKLATSIEPGRRLQRLHGLVVFLCVVVVVVVVVVVGIAAPREPRLQGEIAKKAGGI